MQSRIDDLTNQSSRLHRSTDKTVRDAKFQLAEADRQRLRLEEEVKSYESKIVGMRQAMDELVSFVIHVNSDTADSTSVCSKPRKTISTSRNVGQSGRPLTSSRSHSGKDLL